MNKHTAKDWHGYDVYPDGRVFSNTGWRSKDYFQIKQSLDEYGYPAVRLMINGKRKRERVHKLVATLFHGPKPSPFHQVCHRDGNKLNNVAGNLYWGDARENAADRDRHGTTSKGRKHSSSIIAGQANAKLIAAAPDLLDALTQCRAELLSMIDKHNKQDADDGSWLYDYQTVVEADAAIAKARGEA